MQIKKSMGNCFRDDFKKTDIRNMGKFLYSLQWSFASVSNAFPNLLFLNIAKFSLKNISSTAEIRELYFIKK